MNLLKYPLAIIGLLLLSLNNALAAAQCYQTGNFTMQQGIPVTFSTQGYSILVNDRGQFEHRDPQGNTLVQLGTPYGGWGEAYATFQDDGNLVIYGAGMDYWSSQTTGNTDAELCLHENGQVSIYEDSAYAVELWSSTYDRCYEGGKFHLEYGESYTFDRGYALGMNTRDNTSQLVLADPNGNIMLKRGTSYLGGEGVNMNFQTDGNLVIYGLPNKVFPKWSSNTQNNPGAKLCFEKGNVAIYDSTKTTRLWSAHDVGGYCYGPSETVPLLKSGYNLPMSHGYHLSMQSAGNLVQRDEYYTTVIDTQTSGNKMNLMFKNSELVLVDENEQRGLLSAAGGELACAAHEKPHFGLYTLDGTELATWRRSALSSRTSGVLNQSREAVEAIWIECSIVVYSNEKCLAYGQSGDSFPPPVRGIIAPGGWHMAGYPLLSLNVDRQLYVNGKNLPRKEKKMQFWCGDYLSEDFCTGH